METKNKTQLKKKIVSLGIREDILNEAKKLAEVQEKNLSKYTEDLYKTHQRELGQVIASPTQYLNNLQEQIDLLKEGKLFGKALAKPKEAKSKQS